MFFYNRCRTIPKAFLFQSTSYKLQHNRNLTRVIFDPAIYCNASAASPLETRTPSRLVRAFNWPKTLSWHEGRLTWRKTFFYIANTIYIQERDFQSFLFSVLSSCGCEELELCYDLQQSHSIIPADVVCWKHTQQSTFMTVVIVLILCDIAGNKLLWSHTG